MLTQIARLTVLAEDIREKNYGIKFYRVILLNEFQNSKSQYYRMATDLLNREETFLAAAIDVVSFVYPNGLSSEADEVIFLIVAMSIEEIY